MSWPPKVSNKWKWGFWRSMARKFSPITSGSTRPWITSEFILLLITICQLPGFKISFSIVKRKAGVSRLRFSKLETLSTNFAIASTMGALASCEISSKALPCNRSLMVADSLRRMKGGETRISSSIGYSVFSAKSIAMRQPIEWPARITGVLIFSFFKVRRRVLRYDS